MADIFIGKPWHWGLLVVAFVLLGVVGEFYMHTYAFNTFSAICLAIGCVTVLAVVLTYKPGDRITREPIEEPEE
ncbi:hypothetical protein T8K17_03495 [Thalassobaculum sp. OXR-137]|uniref:hypothetical protein n=1 Tax=Thalassobaculum sp. OXR-137 TaxID=3100173 RepID=UPI002AC8AAD6|nr:hypothetical protein [Thalassobaculum sp. OXR-137]WPZ35211.1 hypothetical protein T8K17_03495 [Thalassobaculum sp. OXR-137]